MQTIHIKFRFECCLASLSYNSLTNVLYICMLYALHCLFQDCAIMTNLFTGAYHAQLYKQFRPVYPPQLLERIIAYCKEAKNEFQTCLDLGCGSGQSTFPLTRYFQTVIGVDPSQTQINEALKEAQNGPSFRVGSAEDLSFQAANSVDLITVAQAFHWFDTGTFYAECSRVLRPKATLAIYGYGTMFLENSRANSAIQKVCLMIWKSNSYFCLHEIQFD